MKEQQNLPGIEEPAKEIKLTLLESLSKEFPESKVKHRLIKDGEKEKVIDYVAGADVIRRLNECFDGQWNFEVKDKIVDIDIGQVAILGKLTTYMNERIISREQWGASNIKCFSNGRIISLGDDIKIATTDSLKKCATMLGIALYLYDGDERDDVKSTDPAPVEKIEKKIEELRKATSKPATKAQLSTIIQLATKSGIDKDNLLKLLEVPDFDRLTYENAAKFIEQFTTGKE